MLIGVAVAMLGLRSEISTDISNGEQNGDVVIDRLVFGQRVRAARRDAGFTLAELGKRIGKTAPFLSQLEHGKKEATLSLINAIAAALEVDTDHLLAPDAPNPRAALEIELERLQSDPAYQSLDLPQVRPSAGMTDEVLETIVGLAHELKARARAGLATPEEGRLANVALREEAAVRGNYFSELEAAAERTLAAIGYEGGALTERGIADIASHFGFTVHQVQDFPTAVRSVTDQEQGRIFIPQRDELRTRASRSVVLRTVGHFALGHSDPLSYADFLRQRMEAAYFASAVLMPREAAVPILQEAKRERDLSVGELRDRFYVSYEMAAHRFTNLATEYLGLRVHLIRSDEEGIVWKAYANNDVPLPTDHHGAIEGQRLCRQWGTRQAFHSDDKFAIHYQYTDTPSGTFWCSTHIAADRQPLAAITVGAGFDDAQFFRGRDTSRHSVSQCPDGECCRIPPRDLASRWDGVAWPSPKAQSRVLAALPAGTFPGVDMAEIYEFLERHRS